MDHKIIGTTMPVLEVNLGAGESVVAESGEMSWMTPSIELETAASGKGGAKVEGLGSEIVAIEYVVDDPDVVEAAMAGFVRRSDPVDLILTAGAASTDPLDACYVAIAALGGRVVRRGVPAHPGSMLWLARIGSTAILGLPTCGAYSKATAADLLLPRLLSGEGPTERTVAKLGHGGILTRSQRFRFPAYARELDAPDG